MQSWTVGPIELVPNYGRKIKYVCEKSCEVRIYTSPPKDSNLSNRINGQKTYMYAYLQAKTNELCMASSISGSTPDGLLLYFVKKSSII